MQTALDALAEMLAQIKALIAAQPCTCGVGPGGLEMCKRCVLLDPRYQ